VGAGDLAGAAGGAGLEAEVEEDFGAAVALARRRARELEGVLLVTGSHYVLAPARSVLRR
jgi:hypothetical protein